MMRGTRREWLAQVFAAWSLRRLDPLAAAERIQTDYYYLRVMQAGGEMAWSSPVWISAR